MALTILINQAELNAIDDFDSGIEHVAERLTEQLIPFDLKPGSFVRPREVPLYSFHGVNIDGADLVVAKRQLLTVKGFYLNQGGVFVLFKEINHDVPWYGPYFDIVYEA
jgi:hypothetical protein